MPPIRTAAARAVVTVLLTPPTQADGPADPWTFDRIKVPSGTVFQGLILEETADLVRFQDVRRKPGRPTVVFTTSFPKRDVTVLERLADADRKLLQERIEAVIHPARSEKGRMDTLDLQSADWNGRANAARRYDSDYFSLTSPAPEEVVRRAAVRLEQIYAAYSRYLPPRHKGGKPTAIILIPSLAEYRAADGQKLANPAYFDPAANRIVCGSDLTRLGDELDALQLVHQQQWAALQAREDELVKLFPVKAERERYLAPILAGRQQIKRADAKNDDTFDQQTRQLFALLYHEAFHAYAGNFVYPPGGPSGELPRWLNEGLAQVFETAVVEAGELRVGHADKERLDRVKELLRGKGPAGHHLTPVADLLRCRRDAFVSLHGGDRRTADRAYLTAWIVAFYLTFDRRLFGSAGLDEYIAGVHRGGDPVQAFETLVGKDVTRFEADLHAYMLRLQPDGSLRPHPRR